MGFYGCSNKQLSGELCPQVEGDSRGGNVQVFVLGLLNSKPEVAWREGGWEVPSLPPAILNQLNKFSISLNQENG